MAEGRLPQWERMECSCGGDEFIEKVYLKYHPTQGSSTEKAGWNCVRCKRQVNHAQLKTLIDIKRIEQDKKEAEERLRALKRESGEDDREQTKGKAEKTGT